MAKGKTIIPPWLTRVGFALVLTVLHSAGHCGDDLVTSQLVDEARVWQSKGRLDLASNAWRRILVTNPQHAEALTSLGIIEAKAGRLEEAQALYVRAKRASKASPNLGRLEEMISPPGSGIENTVQPARTANVSSNQAKRSQEKAARPTKPGENAVSIDTKSTVEKSQQKALSLPPAKDLRPAPMTTAPTVAQTPVPPPSAEVRVTPLPLPQISGNRITTTADSDATDDISLKTSSTLKNNASPTATLPAIGSSSTTNTKRPKPCRLPLATATTS